MTGTAVQGRAERSDRRIGHHSEVRNGDPPPGNQAKIERMTAPCTSVSRRSMPL